MRNWKGVLIVEGVQTGDGRFFVENSITWRDLPLGLVSDHPFPDAHDAIGNVMTIERVGNEIRATGVIDDTTEIGAERCRMLDEGTAPMGNRWPLSIEFHDAVVQIIDQTVDITGGDDEPVDDIENASVEDCTGDECIVIRASGRTGLEVLVASARGILTRRRELVGAAGDGEPEGEVLFEAAQDDIVERYTQARIHAVATVTAGALAGAYMELTGESSAEEEVIEEAEAIVAAALTKLRPPREWLFASEPEDGDERLVPQYDKDTGEYIGDAMPLHIGDDGFVCGHLAPKDRCHIGYAGICVTPPESASAYSHFMLGYTICDDGTEVPTGHLVTGCDHAETIGLSVREARDWYANKGFAWANVRVTPGRFGPWVSGALLPGVSEELVVALRGGGISGDWRGEGGSLELIAALAVNTPGFTVQRALAASAGSVRISAARSFASIIDDRVHLVTRPVMRELTGDPAPTGACGCKTGMTRQERMVQELWAEFIGPKKKAALAARFGR